MKKRIHRLGRIQTHCTIFCMLGLFAGVSASAQYCSPTVNPVGIYLSQIKFDYSKAIAGGKTYITASGGYTETTAASSGTVQRYWGSSIWYNIQNSSSLTKTYHLKLYADWNKDGDFNDFMEENAYWTGNLQPNANLGSGIAITPPLLAAGDVRIRFVLAEGASAPTACGAFIGEVEDYLLTIEDNSAPELSNAGTPFINNLLTSQTATEGFTIAQLLASASPEALTADRNDMNERQLVPRGLAIYDQTATNGTWQYKMGNGAWTDFGAISASNALLLLGNGNAWYVSNVRIRFVPSGVGTASFSFHLWDGTTGINGSYAAITATGGSTAFSTGTKSASVNVVSSLGATLPVFLSGLQQKIFNTTLNPNTGKAVAPANFIGTGNPYSSYDITLNDNGTKLYWISGEYADKIASSNVDGSGLTTSLISGLDGAMGIAISPTKIFYTVWTPGLYSADLNGTNITALTGGAGRLNPSDIGDIGDTEYANNRIYFVYYSFANGKYRIMSAKPDGTDLTELHAINRYIKGLFVTGTHVYWTELNSTVTPEVSLVMKKPLSGGAVQTLASQTGRTFTNLVADEANGAVYVVTADDINSVASELRSVSTGGGSLSTLLSMEGQVTALALKVPVNTLPVLLLQYEARLLPNKSGELKWLTASEQAIDRFIVQKSTDGRNFVPVASVAARGTNAGNASYTWTDFQLVPGNNYYRLLEAAPDGRTKELGIRRIKLGATNTNLKLYPNPVTASAVTVNVGYSFLGAITYQLLDATGRAVTTGSITQQQQSIALGRQPKGFYLLSLSDGQRVQVIIE